MVATRCFVLYNMTTIDTNGFFLQMQLMFVGDEVDGGNGNSTDLRSSLLPADAPTTWESIIRDDILTYSQSLGYTGLVATRIHVPQFKTLS